MSREHVTGIGSPFRLIDIEGPDAGLGFSFTDILTNPATLKGPKDTVFTASATLAKLKEGNRYYDSAVNRPATPNTPVPEVTKDLLDARLEAIEARMDARVSSMSAKLDATLAEIRADRGRFTQLETDIREVKVGLSTMSQGVETKLASAASQTAAQINGLKTNIWFGVATTIASVLAAIALVFAAFDSGRETSKNISEATARMEKISGQLEAAAKVQAAARPQSDDSTKPKNP